MRTSPLLIALLGVLSLAVASGCSSEDVQDGAAGDSAEVIGGRAGANGAGAAGAAAAPPATCDDGAKNGDETDVDCGGATCKKCDDERACAAGGDCASGVCAGGACKAPACDDGVKNGDETDADCGGATCGKCGAGKACAANGDCDSDGCAYDKRCALAPSCVGHHGGDTCGLGETGAADAKHESCCASAKIDRPAASGGDYVLDKYLITAGRMRAFIERVNGDVRTAMAGKPAPQGWGAGWTGRLPSTMDEALWMLGPWADQRRGCQVANGTRTYWAPDAWNKAQGELPQHYPQDVLDEKVQNCVPGILLHAFCIWDGGRLASSDEIIHAWRAGEGRAYPWGNAPSYQADPRRANVGGYGNYIFPMPVQDNASYMSAPGRMTGAGKWGHADLLGPVLAIVRDSSLGLLWTGSLEGHGSTLGISAGWGAEANGGKWALGAYGMAGGRCAR